MSGRSRATTRDLGVMPRPNTYTRKPRTDNGVAVLVRVSLRLVLIRSGNGELLALPALIPLTTSSGELGDKELLGQACANSFSDADSDISEHQPGTTIGSGIPKVCEAG